MNTAKELHVLEMKVDAAIRHCVANIANHELGDSDGMTIMACVVDILEEAHAKSVANTAATMLALNKSEKANISLQLVRRFVEGCQKDFHVTMHGRLQQLIDEQELQDPFDLNAEIREEIMEELDAKL